MGEMSILDDAIREHLELKRAHGADESELKRLEDEAFGPAERPGQGAEQVDPFAEAPTEFLATPEGDSGATPAEAPSGRQQTNIADLQEPPPPQPVAPEGTAEDAATEGPSDEATSEQAEPGGPSKEATSEGAEPEAEGPSEEQYPAMEHQTIAQPASEDKPAPPSDALKPDPEAPQADTPSAAERHAAADQPTELFDVEGQFEDPLAEIGDAGKEVEVSGPAREEPEDEFDEFFSEQRLSDELNQALEAPLPDEPGAPATEESPLLEPGSAPERRDEPEDSAEYDLPEESGEHDVPDHPKDQADQADEYKPHEPGHADALEDTPEFLEESPEDDDAWFEQRPPKDFDFGD
jgi:hypothetical protein